MIRINDIKLPLDYKEEDLKNACASALHISTDKIKEAFLIKKGVDARKKDDIRFSLTVDVNLSCNEQNILSRCRSQNIRQSQPNNYTFPGKYSGKNRPVVVGSGPAGLFAAYILAQCGAKPVVFERGSDVDDRKKRIDDLRINAVFDENCNIQFGEGGAGTFSDGKLNTGIKDSRIKEVLRVFAAHGAPQEILYSAKPHIGTDKLGITVKNLRNKIISLGGKFYFNCKMTSLKIKDGQITGIYYQNGDTESFLECDDVILAIGHSARDTFEMLAQNNVPMAQKPFAIGARIEHLQKMINKAQYGRFAESPYLGSADYKLAAHAPNGRGVYTFCMCPGGYVMPSASERETVVTNGMSEFARDGENANSALLVGVDPTDFGSEDVLAGVALQRKIERSAYILGGGDYKAPVTLVGDFIKKNASSTLGNVKPTYMPGISLTDIRKCLPEYICDTMAWGIEQFSKKIHGFDSPDAVLTAPETRSSSPVRILRGEDMQSLKIKGLYPCGEGAGYAGGITSAAVDGIKCAEAVVMKRK